MIDSFSERITIIPVFQSINIYAKEKARLRQLGTIISDLDLFIGATAIYNDMILITRNVREFERLNNIRIENWVDNQ